MIHKNGPDDGKVSSLTEIGTVKSISAFPKARRPIRNAFLGFKVTEAEREQFKASAKKLGKTATELMEESLLEHYAVDKKVRGRKLAPPRLTKNGATRLALARVLAAVLAQAEVWHAEALDRRIDSPEAVAELQRLNASVTGIAKAAGLFPHIANDTSRTKSVGEKKSAQLNSVQLPAARDNPFGQTEE